MEPATGVATARPGVGAAMSVAAPEDVELALGDAARLADGRTGNDGASEAAFEADVTRVLELYREAGRAMRAGEPADVAGNVTMPQLRVLYFLGRHGASSVGEVAAGVGVAQPSATETLNKLVCHGLVERMPDQNDRRVVRNALTAAGRHTIDRPWEARRGVLAGALRDASPEERAAITEGLNTLCAVLRRGGSM